MQLACKVKRLIHRDDYDHVLVMSMSSYTIQCFRCSLMCRNGGGHVSGNSHSYSFQQSPR